MSKPLQMLIVEDSADDAKLLARELTRGGYQVAYERVDTAEAMKAALKENQCQLILCDYTMPHFNGLEALNLWKEFGADIPFIFVSGTMGEEIAVEAMEAGAHDYVMKGNLQRLVPAIERELKEAELRRAGRQADEALRLSELRYRRLFETAGDGILIVNAETGRMVDVNPCLLNLLGYSRAELQGQRLWEIGSFKNLAATEAAFAEFQKKNNFHADDFLLTSREGNPYQVEFLSNTYLMDGHRVIQCNIRDITARKRAEAELKLFRALIEHSNDGIFVVEPGTLRFLDVNESACRSLGYTRDELLALTVFEVTEGIDRAFHDATVERMKTTGHATVETVHRRKDGTTYPVEVSLSHVKFDRDYVLSVVRDISERKQAEEALRNSARKSLEQAAALISLSREEAEFHGDLTASLRHLTETAAKTLGIARVSIWRPGPEREFIQCVDLFELNTGQHSSGQQLQARDYPAYFEAMTKFDVIDAEDAHTDTRTSEFSESYLRPNGITSMLDVPIRFPDGGGGVVCHEHIGPPRGWSSEEKTFAVAIANLVTRAFARAQRVESEAWLRLQSAALNASANAMVITDVKGNVVWANPAFTRLTGYTVAEALGKNPRVLKSGKHDEAFYHTLWETVLAGKVWHHEVINRRKDGSLYTEDMTITPVKNEAGIINNFIAIKQDVTQRKEAEEALRRSEERFRYAARATHEVIWERNLAPNEFWWSEAFATTFHYPADGVRNHYDWWVENLHPKDRDRVVASLRDLLTARQRLWLGEYRFRRGDGTYAFVVDRGFVLQDEAGAAVRMMGSMMDVTEKKALESQFLRAQRLEGIGTLAGGIAHDLNNILAPILMAAQMLGMKPLEKEDRELIETIERSALRGSNVVKQVLTFARGIQGERGQVQLRHLILEMRTIAQETFPKNIVMLATLPGDLWPVIGDGTQLHQVILNLCINARDAMPHGGQIRVSASNAELDGSYAKLIPDGKTGPFVVLQVTDTGTGIAPEIMDKIFEPFFTTKTPDKGTGLGLSTVAGIVKSHGGFIQAFNEPHAGATFRVYLPAAPSGSAAVAEGVKPVPPLARGGGERILLVDDEPDIRETMRAILDKNGYQVVTAADGVEALVMFAQAPEKFQAVLTDVLMPYMDGVMLSQSLRKIQPGVKIVVLSGAIDSPDNEAKMAELLSLGVNAFITKPCEAEKMLATVHKTLHGTPTQ